MTAKILKVGGILFLSLLVAACGGGSTSSSVATVGVQTMTLPTLPGDPHSIDFYNTSVATRAVIFLHGALGTNYGMANDLGINLSAAPASTANANWNWLNANKVLAVFPQGQAYDQSQPIKYTWTNHVMDSGVDDLVFLQSLAAYITSHYGITDIYLAGHSNGGMMVNRMWCESPATFKGYISLSGPASDYYLTTSCNPATAKPYYGIVGGKDNVLQINGNWGNPTWTIALLWDPGSPYMPDPNLINEWNQQHDTRIPALCPGDLISASGVMDTNNAVETWNNCNGKLKLQKVINSDHAISALEASSGQKMRDLVMAFINQLP